MGHEEELPQCKVFKTEVQKHLDDAPVFRDSVAKHTAQIITLEAAKGDIMADIKEINETLVSLDKKVDNGFSNLKIWILTAAVSGLAVLLAEAVWLGGKIYQVDSVDKAVQELQAMHPRFAK